jgi:hypothetical protein
MKKIRDHLEESGMSYWKHLGHSIKQSNRLIVISIKSYIHGLFPWLFPGDGPLGVYRIYKEIKRMHHVQKMFKKDDTDYGK